MDIIKAQREYIEAQQKFIAALMKNQGMVFYENTYDEELGEETIVFKGNISANVRSFRKKSGLTQAELSAKTGVGTSMLCQIEKGTKVPSLGTALEIAKALGCTVDELCREECA